MANKKKAHPVKEAEGRPDDVPLRETRRNYLRHPPAWLFLLLSAGVVIAIYSNTLRAPFVFDDIPNIRMNTHIQVTEFSADALWDAAFKSICRNRPVANISFAMNYYFHGYDLSGYHLVNIMVHILTGILFFFLVRDTLGISRRQSSSVLASGAGEPAHIAFLASLLWMVHPINTQAVTYIVQRMDSMAAMFYMLSFVCYVQGRLRERPFKGMFLAGSAVSGILAFGTKEIAVTLPLFIFVYEWFFFQDLSMSWLKRRLPWLAGAAVIFFLLILVFTSGHPLAVISSGYEVRDFTMGQRLLTELRVVLYYLGQLVLPHPSRLSLEHQVVMSTSLFNPPTTLLSLCVIALLLAAAVAAAKKERLASFAILWYFGNLALESSFLPLEIMFEHRAYLPSLFILALAVAAVLRFAKPGWVGPAAICLVAAVLSLWTYQRNYVWADEMRLLRDNVQKAPHWARTHTNLGLALLDRGKTDEAIGHLSTALRLSPDRYALYRNLAIAHMRKRQYSEAIGYYLQGFALIRDNRDKALFYLGIGDAYEKMGNNSEALIHYRRSLASDPMSAEAHSAIGQIYAKHGKAKEALDELSQAVRFNPGFSQAYNNMGNVYAQQGNDEEAVRLYLKAIQVGPSNPDAHYNLGAIFLSQGREREAIKHFDQALSANPEYKKARTGLAAVYFGRGELEKAEGLYREGVRSDPGDKEAQKALATVQERRKNIREAIIKARESLEADQQNPLLLCRLGELYRLEGNFSAAIHACRKALSVRADFSQALGQLAVIYTLVGETDMALEQLHKVVRLHPEDPGGYYNIACLYSLRGEGREAVKWLSLAVDKGFHDWDLMRNDKDLYNIRQTAFYKGLAQGK